MTAKRFSRSEADNITDAGIALMDRLHLMNPVPQAFDNDHVGATIPTLYKKEVRDWMQQGLSFRIDTHGVEFNFRTYWNIEIISEMELPLSLFRDEDGAGVHRVRYSVSPSKLNNADQRAVYIAAKTGGPEVYPDNPLYHELVKWTAREIKLQGILRNAKRLFREISKACRTPGQWNTVLPQYTVVLRPDMQRVVANQRGKSKWPTSLPRDEVVPYLSELGVLLLKASMLPETHRPAFNLEGMSKI